METNTAKTQLIRMKRVKGEHGYKSSDGKWFIRHEGTATYWYACELDEQGHTDEYTKQYFRSYQEAKEYVLSKAGKQ
jgi:hypothetical protein